MPAISSPTKICEKLSKKGKEYVDLTKGKPSPTRFSPRSTPLRHMLPPPVESLFAAATSTCCRSSPSCTHHHLLTLVEGRGSCKVKEQISEKKVVSSNPTKAMARAQWTMSYEKVLVDILHEHNQVRYRGQNGWSPEAWRSIADMFNQKCPLANLPKAKIQDKEKELKSNYRMLKEARKQSGVGWNESMGMILAEPAIWNNIIASNSKMKQFQSKPFPLYNQLSALYDGSCATGDLSVTSTQMNITQQNASSQQQVHTQAEEEVEAVSSFRNDEAEFEVNPNLNLLSSNLHGLATSSSRAEIGGGNERTPASSSEQREESHGRKGKQSQIAGVIEEYLDYKKQQGRELLDTVRSQPAERSDNKEDYSIKRCVEVLESMEELTEEDMAGALAVFKCKENRELFLDTTRPRVRLLFLRKELEKQARCP